MILDGHNDKVSEATVAEDFDGFYAIIDSDNHYPMINKGSVLIRPGHTNFVGISATKITALDNLRALSIGKRNCLFPEEQELQLFKNYSKANCHLECSLDYALSKVSIHLISIDFEHNLILYSDECI